MAARSHPKAFTITEMLIVIAVIGLLLGLLFPALGAARRRAYKTTEQNNLRQVFQAWMLYANHNNSAALPGYLEADVQQRWKIKCEYPNHQPVPPAPSYAAAALNIAGPWTWRLMQYVDYAHDVVRGYAEEDSESAILTVSGDPNKAMQIAQEPSFGYNGFYVGGYWSMQAPDPSTPGLVQPMVRFYNHYENGDINQQPLKIPLTVSQISRSSDVITFCSSTKISAPQALPLPRNMDSYAGAHLVMPPSMQMQDMWRPGQPPVAGNDQAMILAPSGDVYIPLGRHNRAAAVCYADGHVDQQTYNGLYDQRKWIDVASSRTYYHDAP